MLLVKYNAYIMGRIVKTRGAIYSESVFSTLNIESEFVIECVIMQGMSDLLLQNMITNK